MAHAQYLYNPGRAYPRVTKFERERDTFRRYVTDTPSAESFANWLRAADGGDIAALQEMQEEMEAKDAFLQGVVNTRRGAITALDWDIVADDVETGTKAAIGAAYCRNRLTNMKSFTLTLRHLASAIGPNLAAVELVWINGEIAEFLPIPGHRLTMCMWRDADRESEGIVTTKYPTGLAFDEIPNKFVVYNHQSRPFPYRKTMTHATVWPYLVRHFSRSDWMAFSELYGSPIRVVSADDSVSEADRAEAQTMLEDLGADAAITKPEGMTFDLLSPSGNGSTYREQMEHAQTEVSVLWLGQTLTTDVGSVGSFAAAKVHDNVRADLLMSDLEAEEDVIRDQILRPMIQFKFPNSDMPVPIFKRLLHERADTEAATLKLAQLDKAREWGLKLTTDEVYEALNLTKPSDADTDTVGGAAPTAPENANGN